MPGFTADASSRLLEDCLRGCMCTDVGIYVCVCLYIKFICICICIYRHRHASTCVCIYIYIYVHVYVWIHTHTYVSLSIYIYITDTYLQSWQEPGPETSTFNLQQPQTTSEWLRHHRAQYDPYNPSPPKQGPN